jgi:hypothetical protein
MAVEGRFRGDDAVFHPQRPAVWEMAKRIEAGQRVRIEVVAVSTDPDYDHKWTEIRDRASKEYILKVKQHAEEGIVLGSFPDSADAPGRYEGIRIELKEVLSAGEDPFADGGADGDGNTRVY